MCTKSELLDEGCQGRLQDDESIRNAILKYEIRHPCVNDKNMVLWRNLGISSWPTLGIISPRGRLLTTLPGYHLRYPPPPQCTRLYFV